jgi:hypothetical protein
MIITKIILKYIMKLPQKEAVFFSTHHTVSQTTYHKNN